jgi:hypothetical protein
MINPSRCYGHFSGMGLAQEKADELAKKHNKTFLVYARNLPAILVLLQSAVMEIIFVI